MTMQLSNLVEVNARFTRSVNLERDFVNHANIDGYILTTTARRTLHRITDGLTKNGGARAWTLTGPFGSGKSAFALYLANLLTDDAVAKDMLKEEDESNYRTLFDSRTKTALPKGRFLPILATGAREPVQTALLRGLIAGLEYLGTPKAEQMVPELKRQLENPENLGDRRLVELLEEKLDTLLAEGEATGLILILDELGKHLEFAAINADSGDLYVLQALAEMAQRSRQAPVVMLTLLHQSFERYAERLTALERSEWSKVQGRFEDVAFQESLEQIVRLISGAINFVGTPETEVKWMNTATSAADRAKALGLFPTTIEPTEFRDQLTGVFPLHPTVAFLLGPLFRKLAQNERSLFAFLSAHEPSGFQEFLISTEFDGSTIVPYSIDRLYDYIVHAFGGGIYNTPSGRRWAEIESTLSRLKDGTQLERRVVKCVGLLSVVGQLGGLKASTELIAYALEQDQAKVAEIVKSLCDRSILVFRGFQQAYGLWEGSDFDLEAQLREARQQISLEESIPSLLVREKPIRPLVARRHSVQTGTLRYFEPRYSLVSDLAETISRPLGDADGAIILTFPKTTRDRETIREFALAAADRQEILLVVPGNTPTLHGYLHDLSCLRWLLRNAPELAGDAVARREVFARISELQRTVGSFLDSLLDDTSTSGHWYHTGKPLRIESRRQLATLLSDICDTVYPLTPRIRNELLNRRCLSSSAAAARNYLLQAMLDRTQSENLGIEGHPAERSMYEALFRVTGIHRSVDGQWGFHEPADDSEAGVQAMWQALEDFLAKADGSRQSVADLFAQLKAPPYGMMDGCLPVVLCGFLLAKEAEAALYEEGAFVPVLSLPHLERLIKTPSKFELQRYRIAGVRRQVFERFLESFRLGASKTKSSDVLDVVRPLCHFAAQLPAYSRKTQQISETSKKVRLALYKAEEPAKLLFEELPSACGFEPFDEQDQDGNNVEGFFDVLRPALKELQTTYDRLLDDIETRFVETLNLSGSGEQAREEFRNQALPIISLALDDQLKSFLIRATDDRLEIKGWVESIATVLTSKPPQAWTDKDRALFDVNLRELTGKYKQLEALAMEVQSLPRSNEDDVLCVGITTMNTEHVQRVVRVKTSEAAKLKRVQHQLEDWLNTNLDSEELRIALLTKLSLKMINKPTEMEAVAEQGFLDGILTDGT